jgi:hypothetical protein
MLSSLNATNYECLGITMLEDREERLRAYRKAVDYVAIEVDRRQECFMHFSGPYWAMEERAWDDCIAVLRSQSYKVEERLFLLSIEGRCVQCSAMKVSK